MTKISELGNVEYIKMFIERADLNLEPYILNSGEVRKGHYFDKEKGVEVCLNDEKYKTVYFTMNNSEDTYEINLVERVDNKYAIISFEYLGLNSEIQIAINSDGIDVKYAYDEGMCSPRIYYDDESNKIVFESYSGETNEYSTIPIDQLVGMVEAIYQGIIDKVENRSSAEEMFELMRPILREAISKVFVNAWKERLANWRKEDDSKIVEKNMGYIIENENCGFFDCNANESSIRYQNDEITINAHGIYSDYSCMRIFFTDDSSNVRIIQNNEAMEPYVHYVFDFENGNNLNIDILDDDGIEFYIPSKKWVKCFRNCDIRQWVHPSGENVNIFWHEQEPNFGYIIRLDEYGVINRIIDKIYDTVSPDFESPKFKRMFELVRPALFQSILRICVKSVSKLYPQAEYRREKVRKLDEIIATMGSDNEENIKSCKSKRIELLCEIERINSEIEDIQFNLYDECMQSDVTKTK